MHVKLAAGTTLVVFAMVLAGCTGNFAVHQTEPIRVQLDGSPEKSRVDQSDSQPQKFVVVNDAKADAIEVNVEVKQVSTSAVTVMVTVLDESTNETLATKTVSTGNTTSSSSTSSGYNSSSSSSTQGQVVNQNIVVNVKGKGNLVVITDAQQGTADVNIAAHEAAMNMTSSGTTGP
jgi:hypothetical protein